MCKPLNSLTLAHDFIAKHVPSGGLCIDATAGRGRDTLLLCRLVGEHGRVLAFDIQEQALDSTRALLEEEGVAERAELIFDSHDNMCSYAQPESVDCIVFNFGWLPGGDHRIFTTADTSIEAVRQGMLLLKPGAIMSLCIYYGRDNGTRERDALLDFLKTLDPSACTVVVSHFWNRGGDPAIPVCIWKRD